MMRQEGDHRMKVNENLRNAIFEVIANQVEANDPPETALTLERLMNEGFSEFQAKQLVGQAVVVEVIDAVKNKKPYNETRYLKNLRNLPKEPEG
jgi:broad-specificity NMP kinase